MYEILKEKLEYILIGGDFIYNSQDYNNYATDNYFKEKDVFNSGYHDQFNFYKDVVSITKNRNFLDVSLANKRNSIIDFRNLIG